MTARGWLALRSMVMWFRRLGGWLSVGAGLSCAVVGGCRKESPAKVDDISGQGVAALPNSVVVVARGTTVRALDAQGNSKWEVPLPDRSAVVAEPSAAPNSTVYVRTASALHAVNDEGKLLWTHELPAPDPVLSASARAPLSLADSSVVLLDSPTSLRAVNVDGSLRWRIDTPKANPTKRLVGDPGSRVLVTSESTLFAVGNQGQVLWTRGLE